jgi:hypothetical protein
VTWANGRDMAPHESGSLGIPSGVEYRKPTIEISENLPSLPPKQATFIAAKGTVDHIVPVTTSPSNIPPAAIIQTIGTVSGTVEPSADIIAGSVAISYNSRAFPTRQALFVIYPDVAVDVDLGSQPFFLDTTNALFDAFFPDYQAVSPGDDDVACTMPGMVYVLCTQAPTLLPPEIQETCATIV